MNGTAWRERFYINSANFTRYYKSFNMNRRTFIEKTALGAGAISIFPQYLSAQSRSFAPSDTINIGFIGVGKQSMGLLSNIGNLPETLVLAASDVDQKKLARFQNAAEEINNE